MNKIDFEWKKTKKLPTKLVELVENNHACHHACKKVVLEAIQHYEKNYLSEQAIWRMIADKYNLNLNDIDYKIENGFLMERKKINGKIQDLHENSEFIAAFKKALDKAME